MRGERERDPVYQTTLPVSSLSGSNRLPNQWIVKWPMRFNKCSSRLAAALAVSCLVECRNKSNTRKIRHQSSYKCPIMEKVKPTVCSETSKYRSLRNKALLLLIFRSLFVRECESTFKKQFLKQYCKIHANVSVTWYFS